MDEREDWRPRLFTSSGPDEGLPEPFPPPNHLRRKERSSFNRSALNMGAEEGLRHSRGRLHRRLPDSTRGQSLFKVDFQARAFRAEGDGPIRRFDSAKTSSC